MEFKVTGIKEMRAKLEALAGKQLPYAMKAAINQTAADVKKALQAEMKTVFDRPTPFTLNAVGVISATKQNQQATVFIKDSDRLGERHHLYAEIVGGGRTLKRFETVLRNKGILPAGMQVVPARDAWLDSYGNVPRSEIVQMLSSLSVLSEQGYAMNKTRTSRGRSKNRYFVMLSNYPRRGGNPVGIWERVGAGFTNVKPVFLFVHPGAYRPRFNFYQVCQNATFANFRKNFKAAMNQAISTAK